MYSEDETGKAWLFEMRLVEYFPISYRFYVDYVPSERKNDCDYL